MRAIRIGYVGELGWELHIPTEFALHVYDLLKEAGDSYGIRDIGYRAIDSLRMEKGYLYWSADITPDYTPVEAGLGFRVHLKTGGDFIGRVVLEKQKAAGPSQSLTCFATPENLPLTGGESLFCDGKLVSLVTSAAFGHTVEQTICFGYLPSGLTGSTDFEIEVFGARTPIKQVQAPLYDRQNRRLKS